MLTYLLMQVSLRADAVEFQVSKTKPMLVIVDFEHINHQRHNH